MRDLYPYEVSLLKKGYRSAEMEVPGLQEIWKNPGAVKFEIGRIVLPCLESLAKRSLEVFGISEELYQKGAISEESDQGSRPGDYTVSREYLSRIDETLFAGVSSTYTFHNPRDGDGLGISVNLYQLPDPVAGVSFSTAYWLHQDGVKLHICGYHLSAEKLSELVKACGTAFGCEAKVVGGLTPEDHPSICDPGCE